MMLAVAEESFTVVYDGSDVSGGRIDVKKLAPSLLALGELVEEAHRVLHPDDPSVSLKIAATEEGSFEVGLVLAESLSQHVANLLSKETYGVVADTLGILGFLGVQSVPGLFQLINWVRNRPIQSASPADEPGKISLTTADGDQLEVPTAVFDLSRRVTIRKNVQEVVSPLGPGIDRIKFGRNKDYTLSISLDEAPHFVAPELEDTALPTSETEKALTIISAVFLEGNKWRFSDGSASFYAKMSDEAFLERVDGGLKFSKRDILILSLIHI